MLRRASKIFSCLAACALLIPTAAQAQEWADPLQSITKAELRDHIHYLASDFLKGRDTGEEGYLLAARYGAIAFDAAGLRPMFTDSSGAPSFFQQITFGNAKVSDTSTMTVTVGGDSKRYGLAREFLAAQILSGGDLNTEDTPVFLGYGIEEPGHGWNDYEGLDVSGKVAVIVGGAPTRNGDPVLPEEQHKIYGSLEQSGNQRVIPAINHGVSALIVVDDTGSISLWDEVTRMMDRTSLKPMPTESTQEGDSGSPPWVVLIRPQEAAEFLSGTDYDPVSRTGTPRPGSLDGVRIALDLKQDLDPAFSAPNVVALLPGTDSILKDEYIVVTAHLDHVGIRNGEVYNGADDNASGSAAVLEAAEAAAMTPARRSIIFVLLTGEEKGLLGSLYFADNPPVPIENIVLNINLDMVGRNSPDWPGSLLAMASENGRPELLALIRDVNSHVKANLDWRLNEGPDPHAHVQRSDQLAFMQKGIPAILITRGFMGPDYHQPSDDPDTINYDKVTQAARLAFALAVEAGNRAVLFDGE